MREMNKKILFWIWATVFMLCLAILMFLGKIEGNNGGVYLICFLAIWVGTPIAIVALQLKRDKKKEKEYNEKYISKVVDDYYKEVIVERDSVCMADDIEGHTLMYTITKTTKFSDLFQDLIHQGYFPYVSGNDVVWTLYCGDEDLMSYKTKENELYSRFITEEPAIFNVKHRDVITISFKYYSSQLKRAEWIFKNFGGQKFHIWHEGFKDEYESYGVSPITEDKWRNNL